MVESMKKDRSPNFPFISLARAVERTRDLYANHKREPARVASVATSWGYAPKSSGLLQTIGALKQFGLIEDLGSGDDRKVQITELARRILMDDRPGAREEALKEAARKPRLISEYLERWVPERPSNSHCLSELQLDRHFTPDAAKSFLKVFDETVSHANLKEDEEARLGLGDAESDEPPSDRPSERVLPAAEQPSRNVAAVLSERLQVVMTGDALTVRATLVSSDEVESLVRILSANKVLLPFSGGGDGS